MATDTLIPETLPVASDAPQSAWPTDWSLADLLQSLGDIPASRIRLSLPLGHATEEDVLNIGDHDDRLFELENGILVEKPMGWYESVLAMLIGIEIGTYLKTHNLGHVLGADGTLKILPGIVKIPDVSFISWKRFPRERLGRRPIPTLIPDLAVEVLSETNTRREMDAKLVKYFQAGVSLVWYIDPDTRTARVYRSPTEIQLVETSGSLDGGDVLPGLQISLAALFEQADRQAPE